MHSHETTALIDAEIRAVRSEMIRRLDENVIPILVRRALARLADGVAPSPSTRPLREKPKRRLRSGTSGTATILRILAQGPAEGMAPAELERAMAEAGHSFANTNKAKSVLHKEGAVVRENGLWRLPDASEHVPGTLDNLSTIDPRPGTRRVVLDGLASSYPEGLSGKALRALLRENGYAASSMEVVTGGLRNAGRIRRNVSDRLWHLTAPPNPDA